MSETVYVPNNNGYKLVCPCGQENPAARYGIVWLKHSEKPRRTSSPETLDETWAKNQDRCAHCGASRGLLAILQIGRQHHHTIPYAEVGHVSPLVPYCVSCHEHATASQRHINRVMKALDEQA